MKIVLKRQTKEIQVVQNSPNYGINTTNSTINISTPADRHFNLSAAVNEVQVRREKNNISVERYGSGPAGTSGDKNFIQNFINTSEVTVNHNLNKYPAVTVTDSTGDEVIGEIEHVSVNQLTARFSSSFTGRIVCN